MNLITDPILTLSDGDRVSLPALFAAMAQGRVRGFPGVTSAPASGLAHVPRTAWRVGAVAGGS